MTLTSTKKNRKTNRHELLCRIVPVIEEDRRVRVVGRVIGVEGVVGEVTARRVATSTARVQQPPSAIEKTEYTTESLTNLRT